jgi:D-alanine-D-alanine ligase
LSGKDPQAQPPEVATPASTLHVVRPGGAFAARVRGFRWSKLVRPKGNLSRRALAWLGAIAALPFVLMVIRILALPGIGSPTGGAMDGIRSIGNLLNQAMSLRDVPFGQRDHVLYLLFLPTSALLVALARLTFGIRVLGFRSILIAVGFHQSGILPSLILIAVAVATIIGVRPWLRRIRLPYYARVSVILCIVAVTMVVALLLGPWLRADLLWSVAYFPVIVLGMLAEGIAHTLDRDNMVTASWRAVTTILLAFVIALVCQAPPLRVVLLQFPELVLTQIVAIFLVAEFLDWRLFQDWDSKVAGIALPKLLTNRGAFRVAVVRNRDTTGVIGRLGRPGPKKYTRKSVQKIVDALRERGHTVRVLEGDISLLKELRKFIPPDPRTGQPGGIVLNLAHGIQGQARAVHVPAMLEMSGIAYTGANPLGQALILDRVAAKTLMQQAGVLTPAFVRRSEASQEPHGLNYPLLVKPRYEPAYDVVPVTNRQELRQAIKDTVRRTRQEVLVEEFIDGRQINVALLGNDPVECLPLVEVSAEEPRKTCPARIDEALEARIRAMAIAAFQACGCRDYARVDVRVGECGNAYVLEIETLGILERGGSFATAGEAAGYSFARLLGRILEIARARYRVKSIRPLIAPPPAVD